MTSDIHFQTPMWTWCPGNDWCPIHDNETMSDIHHHIHSCGPTVLGMTNLLTKTLRWCMTCASTFKHPCGSAVLEMTDLLIKTMKQCLTSIFIYIYTLMWTDCPGHAWPPNKATEVIYDIHAWTLMWIYCLGNDWPPNHEMSDIHYQMLMWILYYHYIILYTCYCQTRGNMLRPVHVF